MAKFCPQKTCWEHNKLLGRIKTNLEDAADSPKRPVNPRKLFIGPVASLHQAVSTMCPCRPQTLVDQ